MKLDQIARVIRATREEFRSVFLEAQVGAPLADRVEFEAIAPTANDVDAFERALDFAASRGFLDELLDAIDRNELHSGALLQLLAAANSGNAELQAISARARHFRNPDDGARVLGGGMRWTVRVLVDGEASGTGVLIGPNLVLTAWHVVAGLFVRDASGARAPERDAARRLSVEFDSRLVRLRDAMVPVTSLLVPAHRDWCVVFSPCHDDELASRLPQPIDALDGNWDYAVLRLAGTPGMERRWIALDRRAAVPRPDTIITLFQHPGRQQHLAYDASKIVAPDPAHAAVVPRVRFLHAANALQGSSGGPCFDATSTLFGIHQGVWPNDARKDALNRGIPISRVYDDISRQIGVLPPPSPEDTPVFELFSAIAGDAPQPLIGRDQFVASVWRAAMGKPRILAVNGDRARGKTLCVDVVAHLLPTAGHQKIGLLSNSAFAESADELAKLICSQAGAALPAFEPLERTDSTPAVWLTNELVPKLLQTLDDARNGRVVWLMFREMNKVSVFGRQTRDLLNALCESVRSADWLRLVLDGISGDIPFSVQSLTEYASMEAPDERAVATYYRRSIAQRGLEIPEHTVAVFARMTINAFKTELQRQPSNALAALSEHARTTLSVLMETLPGAAE